MKNVPNIPKEILDASARGKLVVFVGAGVSRIIGCPSWKELAYQHLEYLFEQGAINYYEFEKLQNEVPRKLLSICRKVNKEKGLPPLIIGDLLKAKEELIKKYPIYDDLYAFNAIYLTTNYDDSLEKAALKSSSSPAITSADTRSPEKPIDRTAQFQVINGRDDLLLSSLKNGNIIHLHGSIQNEQELIVTIVEYMTHYDQGSKPSVILEDVFKSYTVLFVGYGLEEYEILEFMINKSSVTPGVIKHYMLYPVFEVESNLLKFQKKYYSDLGVQLISYPVDENGYEQLATVVTEWAKHIGPKSRQQAYYDKIKLIDEVI